jgi:hypothetical protein
MRLFPFRFLRRIPARVQPPLGGRQFSRGGEKLVVIAFDLVVRMKLVVGFISERQIGISVLIEILRFECLLPECRHRWLAKTDFLAISTNSCENRVSRGGTLPGADGTRGSDPD